MVLADTIEQSIIDMEGYITKRKENNISEIKQLLSLQTDERIKTEQIVKDLEIQLRLSKEEMKTMDKNHKLAMKRIEKTQQEYISGMEDHLNSLCKNRLYKPTTEKNDDEPIKVL
jgi:DNA-binding transcriptional MerR regulator